MEIFDTPAAIRAWSRAHRAAGRTVGFVPTMGYLHEGHLSLVREARSHADVVAVSIYVNPTQFGPSEDLDRYPRDEEGDMAKLRGLDVEAVFYPSTTTMYPPGHETSITLAKLPAHLCGLSRPVHFGGVATIVTKLFNIVEPDVAVFGEKDYQQLLVIKKLVRDLDLPVTIVGGPIVREPDGIAMSSRNAYLSDDERARATIINRSLTKAAEEVAAGATDARHLASEAIEAIEDAGGVVDYVAMVDTETLDPVTFIRGSALMAIAARFGQTRLIDNRVLVAG